MSEENNQAVVKQLTEIFIGKMEAVLTMSLGTEYNLSLVKEFPVEDMLMASGWDNFVCCHTEFGDSINGKLFIFIEPNYGAKLADLMVMGDGNVEFNEDEHVDALQELSNQTFGGFVTDLGALLEKSVSIVDSGARFTSKMELPEEAHYCCEIKFDEDNTALFVISEEIFDSISPLLTLEAPEEKETVEESGEPLSLSAEILKNNNLQQILNTNLDISIIYGSTEMKISDILNVNDTSVIELDKHANEPVDIYVNGKIFAKGEIVVVEKNYGIVIKKIISVKDRILSLRE